MWSKRPEWQDVEPVPQDDAPNALVPIAYHEYCKSPSPACRAAGCISLTVWLCVGRADRDAMDMFRALVAKQEKSQRTLDLTKEIIQMNPGHYTVW